MRTYRRKTERGQWSPVALRSAVRAVERGVLTLRAAVREYGIPRTTLRDRLKARCFDKPVLGKQPVFSEDFDDELAERVIYVSNMFYGITTEKLSHLAFEFAERQRVKHPFKNGRAGPDWVAGFLRRHPEISVRKPESISLARLEGVNKKNVQKFYDNIRGLVQKNGPYPSHRIFNVDETGVAPVVASPKVLAARGDRRVGRVATAERGKLTTIIGCVSASCACVPPMLVFGGRKRMDPTLLAEAPEGAIGGVSDSGWVTTQLFLQWFHHFVEHAGPSKERRVLLIMDNHTSHISSDIITQARLHGVDIVTIPPHSSHVLQPLDLTIYGPLKQAWARQIGYHHDANPGHRITDRQIGGIFARAWRSVMDNQDSIKNGFETSGICPFNPDRVMENPSNFTHNLVVLHEDDEQDLPLQEEEESPHPEEPGRYHPAEPGQSDPEEPGQSDPAEPGRSDPAEPGQSDPEEPGQSDPAEPGSSEPADPGQYRSAELGSSRPVMRGSSRPAELGSSRPVMRGSSRPAELGSSRPVMRGSSRPVMRGSSRPVMRGSSRPAELGSSRPVMRGSSRPVMRGSSRPVMRGSSRPAELGPSRPAEPRFLFQRSGSCPPQLSGTPFHSFAGDVQGPAASPTSPKNLLDAVFPAPKVKVARKQTFTRKRQASLVLTSSPMKVRVLEKEQKKENRKKNSDKAKGKKKAKTGGAVQREDVCIYCTEGVVGRGEIWLQCAVCLKWAHELCSGVVGSAGFTCDFCR